MKRTSFGVLVLKGLVNLHRTVQIQLLHVTGWAIGFDYHDVEWFALEMNKDHSVVYKIAPKYCISDTFLLTMRATPFFKGIFAHSNRYNGHLS